MKLLKKINTLDEVKKEYNKSEWNFFKNSISPNETNKEYYYPEWN